MWLVCAEHIYLVFLGNRSFVLTPLCFCFSLLFWVAFCFSFLSAKLSEEQSFWIKTVSLQTVSTELTATNGEPFVSWMLVLLCGRCWRNSSVCLSFTGNFLGKYLPLHLLSCLCLYQNLLFLIFRLSDSTNQCFIRTIDTMLCFVQMIALVPCQLLLFSFPVDKAMCILLYV